MARDPVAPLSLLACEILAAAARAVDGVDVQPGVDIDEWASTPEAYSARELTGAGLGTLRARRFTINDAGRTRADLVGSLDAATVDGVALRKGDRVEWEGFGGIAWTGRGEIVGLVREYDGEGWPLPGAMLAVRFDHSGELDPFGDDVGEPVVFVADAVTQAVRRGKLRVLGHDAAVVSMRGAVAPNEP